MSSSTDLNTGIQTHLLIDYSPIDTHNTYSYTDGNIHYKNLPGELDNQNTYLSINLWDTGNAYCSVYLDTRHSALSVTLTFTTRTGLRTFVLVR